MAESAIPPLSVTGICMAWVHAGHAYRAHIVTVTGDTDRYCTALICLSLLLIMGSLWPSWCGLYYFSVSRCICLHVSVFLFVTLPRGLLYFMSL